MGMYIAFAGFVIALLIFVAVYLNILKTNSRHAEIEKLIDQYADLKRRHLPREHVWRRLMQLQCEELVS